jgi:DNA-binding CsgD family transcriptional regulator
MPLSSAAEEAAMSDFGSVFPISEEPRFLCLRGRATGAELLSESAWQAIANSLRLSGRELEIVRAIFDGLKERAIAARLGVAPRTVHTHVERLYRKLVVNDRAHLALCVMGEFLALTASSLHILPSICPIRAAGLCPVFNCARSEGDCSAGSSI